jgi:hypothetical protein
MEMAARGEARLPSMEDFLKALIKRRSYEKTQILAQPNDTATPQEVLSYMDELLQTQRTPIDVPITLTYIDRSLTRKWQRIETLRYDPATGHAYMEHGKPREITM